MSDFDVEYLAHHDTAFGTMILRRHELPGPPTIPVTEILLDEQFLMSSRITFSERRLATAALEMHEGEVLEVLVGGLGLGYTVFEVASSARVGRAEVVEIVSGVIAWMKDGLVPLSSQVAAEPRIEIIEGDIFRRLAEPPDPVSAKFDVILIDVDHCPTEPLDCERDDGFYTAAGLRAATRHLTPGGVLGVWSYAEDSTFARAMREVFDEVRVEPVSFFNDVVDAHTTDWLFFGRNRVS